MTDQPKPQLQDLQPTINHRGYDVSGQYFDDLDKACCDHIASLANPEITAVDLGGGKGGHSIRMATMGAKVLMIDVADMAQEGFKAAVADGTVKPGALTFLKKDFEHLTETDFPPSIDLVYSQRAIHYLPYDSAKKCLSLIFGRMAQKGAIFISAAGMGSEFGATYPDRDLPVHQRFNTLAPDMQAKYNTREKLVLYRQEDMHALLDETGFRNISFIPSSFGQVRAVAVK